MYIGNKEETSCLDVYLVTSVPRKWVDEKGLRVRVVTVDLSFQQQYYVLIRMRVCTRSTSTSGQGTWVKRLCVPSLLPRVYFSLGRYSDVSGTPSSEGKSLGNKGLYVCLGRLFTIRRETISRTLSSVSYTLWSKTTSVGLHVPQYYLH